MLDLDFKKVEGVAVGQATLHSAAGATDDGDWVNVEAIGAWSIDVTGISGDTLKARGSNKVTIPADSDDERSLGSDIKKDGVRQYNAPIKWFKVKISDYNAGVITVVMKVRNSI